MVINHNLYNFNILIKDGQPNSTIINVFKKNEYEYIVKTMNMVNHSKDNPKLYELAIKLLGYMKRKSKVANETKVLPLWFIDETNIDALDDKNSFIGYFLLFFII